MSGEQQMRQALIDHTRELTGCADTADAERIACAVLAVLLEQLGAHDRSWLAQTLCVSTPTSSADVLPRPVQSLAGFYARVARHEHIAARDVLQCAQSVCRALTEALAGEALVRLVRRLPDELVVLFAWSAQAGVRRAPDGAREPAASSVIAQLRELERLSRVAAFANGRVLH